MKQRMLRADPQCFSARFLRDSNLVVYCWMALCFLHTSVFIFTPPCPLLLYDSYQRCNLIALLNFSFTLRLKVLPIYSTLKTFFLLSDEYAFSWLLAQVYLLNLTTNVMFQNIFYWFYIYHLKSTPNVEFGKIFCWYLIFLTANLIGIFWNYL